MRDATAAMAQQRTTELRRAGARPSLSVAAAGLANSWVFSTLSQRELRQLAKRADTRRVGAGEVLVSEDTAGNEFFVLLEGRVRVTRRARRVTTLGAGASFGELALLDDGPRTATVLAETDVTVLVLRRREFERLLAGSGAFARKLLSAMARRLVEADRAHVECS
jgi:CRP-like cAMP-binding protein